jgi:peptide/nickel transport system substrate-binding protein
MLAALLLMIAASCGGDATSTPVPRPAATAVSASTAVSAATATPVPVATATTVPEVMEKTGDEPFGELNVGMKALGVYHAHPGLTSHPEFANLGVGAIETLFGRDNNGKYFGRLLESWSISDDTLTWTFKLKEGIPWHVDALGNEWGELTAEDVIWSFNEAGAEGSVSTALTQVRRIFLNENGYFKALDDYTIELNTGQPTWDLYDYAVNPSGSGAWVTSKKQWEELSTTIGEDAANAVMVGTGPWRMTETSTSEWWKFEAQLNHYNKTPFFKNMTLFEIPEESTLIANFETGIIDVFQAQPDSLARLAGVEGTKFMAQENATDSHIGLYGSWYATFDGDNCPEGATHCPAPAWNPDAPYVSSNPDLDSPEWEAARKVRLAMGISIDRQKLVDELLRGEGKPGNMWGWALFPDRELPHWKWEYNPEKAKQLLVEAGYPDGFELDIVPSIRGGPAEIEMCEAVTDMWADIGIKANLQKLPYSAVVGGQVARTTQALDCHAVNPVIEPAVLWTFEWDPKAGWSAGVDHPYITPLLYDIVVEFDTEKRWKLQQELADWIWDQSLEIGLYTANSVYALGPKLDSWEEHMEMSDPRRISALNYAPHRK